MQPFTCWVAFFSLPLLKPMLKTAPAQTLLKPIHLEKNILTTIILCENTIGLMHKKYWGFWWVTYSTHENAELCILEVWMLIHVYQNNFHIFWGNVHGPMHVLSKCDTIHVLATKRLL